MAPKTKKNMLKVKPNVTNPTQQSFLNTFNACSQNLTKDSITFKSFLDEVKLSDLRDALKYMKHNKSNLEVKLPMMARFHPSVKDMIKAKEWLEHAIGKSEALVNDSIIHACDNDDSSNIKDCLIRTIEVAIGVKEDREMKP